MQSSLIFKKIKEFVILFGGFWSSILMLPSQICLGLPGSLYHSRQWDWITLNMDCTSALSEIYELSLAYICNICNELILNTVSGIMTASSVSLWLNDIQTWNQFPLDCSPWKQTKSFLHSFLANRYGFYVVLRLLHRFTKCDSCSSSDTFLSFFFESFHSSVSLLVIFCRYKLPSMFHLIRLAAEDKLTPNVDHRNILIRQTCIF